MTDTDRREEKMNEMLSGKSGGDIFIVDDEVINIRVLTAMLKKQGYEVRAARSGETALIMIRNRCPDLLLLDIRMPEPDGYQVCRQLKEDRGCRDIPVIFISALDHILDKVRAFEVGGVDYLTKPFQEEEVIKRVETHLTLCSMQKNLQKMVKERTAELFRTNENLKKELARRQKAEARMQRLSVAVEHAAEDIVITDRKGRIEYVNPAFTRITAYSPEEVTGKNPRILKSGRHSDAFYREMWQTLLTGKVWSGRLSNRRKDGNLIEQEANIAPIRDNAGNISGFVSVKRDVTENEKLKAQLLHAQKMEAVGTLAGGISHDFNNILGGIIGYAELAMEHADKYPEVPGKTKKYLSRILESANRATELVQQILRFSRQQQADRGIFEISPLVKEVLRLLDSTLPKNIRIEKRIAADRDSVTGDPTHIHQVLMNICTNAYHAMRESGGTLTLELENTEIRERKRFLGMEIPAGDYLRFSVSDTGSGIPPEILDRIFDPYFTTKKVGEGTGLGLSVSAGIVQNHHGLIEAESSPGQGTVFRVYLPLAPAAPDMISPEKEKIPRGRGQKILFADDEHFFLEAIAEQLRNLDYEVTALTESRRALKLISSDPRRFDLVLTDQTMPDMTGIQLAGEIRKLNPEIPIILCTGFSETVTEQTAGEYGISKFLMKPVHREELAKAVYELLSGSPVSKPEIRTFKEPG